MDGFRLNQLKLQGGNGTTGFFIDPTQYTGWDDGVDVRLNDVARAQAHGSFDIPQYLAARVVAVGGLCFADSVDKLEWYRGQLMSAIPDSGSRQLIGQFGSTTTWVTARLGAQPKFTPIVWGSIASWSIQFWCPDPRRYGPYNTFGPASTVSALHYGNFTAAPVLTVTGTMPTGYTITGPSGKVYTVTAAVTSGNPHTIDMSTGYLTIGGVIQTGVVTVANTWGIPAGTIVPMTLTPLSGSGTLTAVVKDTSI